MATNTRGSGPLVFDKEFTRQESIPEAGIRRAVELMRSGRLHRYNTPPEEESDVSLLEQEFAAYVKTRYCVALNSCGSAIYVALKSAGVKAGSKVLCNALTLAPAPSAIENAGAETILVGIKEDYTVDVVDLERKAKESKAKFLLLSHMRGHIADMDKVCAICDRHGVYLIEDCAHTMGAKWGDRHTGTFGRIGCYSTQTYKHMNSGEGGLLVTNDDEVIAKAILYSGSYMFYDRHVSRPPVRVFERFKKHTPNFSLRMSNLQAAILRPQLTRLDKQCERWNKRYALLEKELNTIDHITVPKRNAKECFVGSSMQFNLYGLTREQVEEFLDECSRRGVEIKWFGWKEPKGYTSSYESWQYLSHIPELPQTKKILDSMCDFRIPLTFSLEDCKIVAGVIREVIEEKFSREAQPGSNG